MFVGSVLAFILGIYAQAVNPLPTPLTLSLLTCSLALIPILLRRGRIAVLCLILLGFSLVGSLRVALVPRDDAFVSIPERRNDLYGGTVIESSATMTTVRLSSPALCRGIRAVFVSDVPMPINTEIRVVGLLRELRPSFKNPSVGSWKWLKRLEGIGYELKGRLVSMTAGTSLVEGFRGYFKKTIEQSGARHTDVLTTLTVGDRTSLDQGKNDLFIRTGTSHVLAISGFNVGIVSGFFFFFLKILFSLRPSFRLSGRHTRYAALVTMPFPFAFMFVA
ncbi:MAG TPA: hypothetical protein DCR97_12020, partial [Deltaproteobacteria bacterium]|nr:hypothetical protein [Deltaproteobacteria bacterium]